MSETTEIPETRESYAWFVDIPTRWMDVDVYGHVNNVEYYSYFDTAVAAHLIEVGGLDPHNSPVIGLVIETKCLFKKSLLFPIVVNAGLRVVHIGRSSVRYEIGLFREGDDEPAATGHFVHVYVERQSQKPAPIPDECRAAMETLMMEPSAG
jgi:acyl-CoA thioester hydrolase